MKIPQGLPQFKNEQAIIIVAGKQAAVFYAAKQGEIERIDAFKIPTPRYSDDEGRFGGRIKGGVMGAGGFKEIKDQDIIKDFLREFKQRIKPVAEPDAVYICAPDQTKNKILAALPSIWKGKVKGTIVGNYYYKSPQFILEKIKEK